MSTMSLTQTNGSKAGVSPTWLQLSVQKFFTGINWDDNPPAVQEMKLSVSQPNNLNTDGPLSLSLSVSQFFATVNWDGVEIAAPVIPQAQIMPPPKADELTLDDFSSLF